MKEIEYYYQYKVYLLESLSCDSDDLTDFFPMSYQEFVEKCCNNKE